MKRPLPWAMLVVLAAILVAGCGGGSDESSTATATSEVKEEDLAARVDDWTLTKDRLYQYIEDLPEQQRRRFDSHQGRAEAAARFIEEELYYQEGKRVNVEDIDWVQRQIEDAKRRIIVGAYFKEYVEPKARPTEEEIHDYYEAHQDVYTTLEIARAQHIFSKSKEKLDDILERIVDGGEPFTTMAHKYSEDKITQRDGGDLGYFNPGGYIRGVGYSDEFSRQVFDMEVGRIYGPIQWERGWSLVVVNEKRPPELRPYADVRDEISNILTQEEIDKAKVEAIAELSESHNVRNYMEEYFHTIQRSPEELFAVAATTTDPQAQINAYQEVIDTFPDHPMASKAQFMIGFVYAEGMNDYVMADKAFNKCLNLYPESDEAETARWMRDNLGKELPEFEDIDDLNKKLKKD